MIFVTVGTQLPFDRLIEAVDDLAPLFPNTEFIAQAYGTRYAAKHIKTLEFVPPADFGNYINKAELIISHAGIGTILSVSQMGKPLIIFPRLAKYKEHRNDHQLATCRMLESRNAVHVAYDKKSLKLTIENYFSGNLQPVQEQSGSRGKQLVSSIQHYIGNLITEKV